MLRQEHGGLPSGIASAYQDYLAARAHLRFERGGPIRNATAFEFGQSWHWRMAITRAAGNDDRSGSKPASVCEPQRQLAVRQGLAGVERGGLRRDHDLGAELLRLDKGTAGKRLAGDAGHRLLLELDPPSSQLADAYA